MEKKRKGEGGQEEGMSRQPWREDSAMAEGGKERIRKCLCYPLDPVPMDHYSDSLFPRG